MATFFFFFFNDTATTEIYTLSLHDALPIFMPGVFRVGLLGANACRRGAARAGAAETAARSEEHTSELQSPCNLVCRLLLEKKKKTEPPTLLTPEAIDYTNPHLHAIPTRSTR